VTGSCYAAGTNVSNKRQYLCASLGTAVSVVPKENYEVVSHENLKYVLSHNLLNTKGTQWLRFSM